MKKQSKNQERKKNKRMKKSYMKELNKIIFHLKQNELFFVLRVLSLCAQLRTDHFNAFRKTLAREQTKSVP